jgi:acetyl esterase/lipase
MSLLDAAYPGPSARSRLDLHLPEGPGPFPLVVFLHGGAFFKGDKASVAEHGLAAMLARGWAVASVNYRYSSEAVWPAQVDDLRSAFAWLRARPEVDAARIAAFGPSAGGHLAAAVALALAGDPATRLAAAVCWFPPVDFVTMDADMAASGVAPASGPHDAADSPESRLIGAPVADAPDLARAAGPLAQLDGLSPGTPLPPFLILHGALDPLIAARQSQRLAAGLAGFGTCPRLELAILPDGTHGGGGFRAPAVLERVLRFLSQSFGEPA